MLDTSLSKKDASSNESTDQKSITLNSKLIPSPPPPPPPRRSQAMTSPNGGSYTRLPPTPPPPRQSLTSPSSFSFATVSAESSSPSTPLTPPPPPPRHSSVSSSSSSSIAVTSTQNERKSAESKEAVHFLALTPPVSRFSSTSSSSSSSAVVTSTQNETKSAALKEIELMEVVVSKTSASVSASVSSSAMSNTDSIPVHTVDEKKSELGPEPDLKNRVQYITWLLQGGLVSQLQKNGKEQDAKAVEAFLVTYFPKISEGDIRPFFNRKNWITRFYHPCCEWMCKCLSSNKHSYESSGEIRKAAAKEKAGGIISTSWQAISNGLYLVLLIQAIYRYAVDPAIDACFALFKPAMWFDSNFRNQFSLATTLTRPANIPVLATAIGIPFLLSAIFSGRRYHKIPVDDAQAKELKERLGKYEGNTVDDLLLLGIRPPIGLSSQTLRFNGLMNPETHFALMESFLKATKKATYLSKVYGIKALWDIVNQFDRDPELWNLYETDPETFMVKFFIPALACLKLLEERTKVPGLSQIWFRHEARLALADVGKHASRLAYVEWVVSKLWLFYTSAKFIYLLGSGVYNAYQQWKEKVECENQGEGFEIVNVNGKDQCLACSGETRVVPISVQTSSGGRQACTDFYLQTPRDASDTDKFIRRIPHSKPETKISISLGQQDGSHQDLTPVWDAASSLSPSLIELDVNMVVNPLTSDNAFQLLSGLGSGSFQGLKRLDLSYQTVIAFNTTVFNVFINALNSSSLLGLESFKLKGMFLSGAQMATIASILPSYRYLTVLAVDLNIFMGAIGAAALADALSQMPQVNTFTQSGCFIGSNGMIAMASALKNRSLPLTYWDTSNNNINTAAGARAFWEVVNQTQTLQTVIASNNRWGSQGMNVPPVRSDSLISLWVFGCNMGTQGAQWYKQNFFFPNLQNGEFSQNGIGDQGLLAIVSTLSDKLTSLGLSINGISANGFGAVAQQLGQQCPSLTSLNLNQNSFGSGATQNFTVPTSVTNFQCNQCSLGIVDLINLLKLQQFTQLQLQNNYFGPMPSNVATALMSSSTPFSLSLGTSDWVYVFQVMKDSPAANLNGFTSLNLMQVDMSNITTCSNFVTVLCRGASNLQQLWLTQTNLPQSCADAMVPCVGNGFSPTYFDVSGNPDMNNVSDLATQSVNTPCANSIGGGFLDSRLLALATPKGKGPLSINAENTNVTCTPTQQACSLQSLVYVDISSGCVCPLTSAASHAAEPLFIFLWMGIGTRWLSQLPSQLLTWVTHLAQTASYRFISVAESSTALSVPVLSQTLSQACADADEGFASQTHIILFASAGLLLSSPRFTVAVENGVSCGMDYVKTKACRVKNVMTAIQHYVISDDEQKECVSYPVMEMAGQVSQQIVFVELLRSCASKESVDLNQIWIPLVILGMATVDKIAPGLVRRVDHAIVRGGSYVWKHTLPVRETVSHWMSNTYTSASSWAKWAVDSMANQLATRFDWQGGPTFTQTTYTPS